MYSSIDVIIEDVIRLLHIVTIDTSVNNLTNDFVPVQGRGSHYDT